MRKFKNILTIGLMTFTLLLTSCSKDGAIGPQGIAGQNGAAGTNGTNGTNGIDGNANVQAFIYDISAVASSSLIQSIPELTQDVIDNDVILSYVVHQGGYEYPVPTVQVFGAFDVMVAYVPGQYEMYFYNADGTSYSLTAGELVQLKVIIIESTSTTTGKSGKSSILSELKTAGVNIKDYYAVMAYYGKG